MPRTTRFLLLLLLMLLTGCRADKSAVLPNLLVQVEGQIEVRRAGSTPFVPVGIGTAVQFSDTLYLTDGEASIFCGNERLWNNSPQILPVDEEIRVEALCPKGRPPRPARYLSPIRGSENSVSNERPYVLSPRSGFVLNERPTLRWQLLPGVETYTVTLFSDDGQERPPITISGSTLSYPDQWPPLEANGASYVVLIEGGGQYSDQEGGFSLLDQRNAQQVKAQAERLRHRPLDELSLTLLLAELHLNERLRSEAVELLLALPDGDQVVAVQRLLGETYLDMGLLDEATDAYSQTLTLAKEPSLQEEQASVHLGLGLAACAQADEEKARTHWQEALKLYDEMERSKDEDDVEARLAEVESTCNN